MTKKNLTVYIMTNGKRHQFSISKDEVVIAIAEGYLYLLHENSTSRLPIEPILLSNISDD